jgi:hypothetical protein
MIWKLPGTVVLSILWLPEFLERLRSSPLDRCSFASSDFPTILFAWNTCALDKRAVAALADKDDGTANVKPGEVTPLYLRNRLLRDSLPYAKVTDGFLVLLR